MARRLPIQAHWSKTRAGSLNLEIPGGIFTAVVERDGHHLTVTLTRDEGETVRAILHDLLSITLGTD